jgi:hypothetical protein
VVPLLAQSLADYMLTFHRGLGHSNNVAALRDITVFLQQRELTTPTS